MPLMGKVQWLSVIIAAAIRIIITAAVAPASNKLWLIIRPYTLKHPSVAVYPGSALAFHRKVERRASAAAAFHSVDYSVAAWNGR
jgi:hypothetical protein